jgi:hypothetical protein
MRRLSILLVNSIVLPVVAFCLVVSAYAQLPAATLTIPQPDVRAAQKPDAPAPHPMADLHVLVARLMKYADSADCRQKGCRLLVANFSLPDGGTSHYGMQLADELSRELANQVVRSK